MQQMACVLYHGNLHQRACANFAVYSWAFDHRYWFDGCIREIYYRVVNDDTNHPNSLVEIQYPIVKDQGN
jgi:effector-binding domain-containing protein